MMNAWTQRPRPMSIEIAPDARLLFDRIHGLIVGEFPDVEVGISYRMPVYRRDLGA